MLGLHPASKDYDWGSTSDIPRFMGTQPDGRAHAEIWVMAASDNVLRAGLTTKALDPVALVRCLDKGMSRLARVTPEQFGFSTEVFSPDVEEFALAVSQCGVGSLPGALDESKAEPQGTLLPPSKQPIVVCTGGEVAWSTWSSRLQHAVCRPLGWSGRHIPAVRLVQRASGTLRGLPAGALEGWAALAARSVLDRLVSLTVVVGCRQLARRDRVDAVGEVEPRQR